MDFALQYLQHGKALCGAVFGTFVETFNRLVDFHVNLKGDGDISDDGLIKVDRADPAHPVIRLDKTKLTDSSDSGGDDSGDDDSGGDDSGGDEDEAKCVTSANAAKGDVYVIGGEHIEVSTDGQTIKISYNADKETEDEDPNADGDPCDHDGVGGDGGGVDAGGADGEGGVPADGDTHPGSDCNCE